MLKNNIIKKKLIWRWSPGIFEGGSKEWKKDYTEISLQSSSLDSIILTIVNLIYKFFVFFVF
jgi:hypothetical protein